MLPPSLALLAAFTCSALVAQDPIGGVVKPVAQPAKPAASTDARTEQRSQSMREQIGSGRQVESHVRVAVRLKNGNRLTGVVKDGRLVERVDGLRFVDAQAGEAGAGIRLWYSGSVRNYVFVPFADFADYKVVQRLTAKQLADIEREMQAQEAPPPVTTKTDAEVAAAPAGDGVVAGGENPAAPAAEGAVVAPKVPKAGGAGAGDPALSEQQRKWFALMQAYPPKEGWNKAKRDEIARRFVVVGAKPSAVEQQFVDDFAEWEKACAHFGADPKEADTADQAGTDAAPKGKGKGRSSKSATEPPTAGGASGGSESTAKNKRRKQ